jgi:hypothetical protein
MARASTDRIGRKGVFAVEVRSALRAGRSVDTPPLGRALQSACSALGLLVDLKVIWNAPSALPRCWFT